MTLDDLSMVASYDARIFGADRAPLLADLLARVPGSAFVAERHGAPCGFVLARDGHLATQIGPLIADDSAVARHLLERALAATRGPVFLDLPEGAIDMEDAATKAGFVPGRRFVRMARGTGDPADTARYHALAGPEFG
jgi:hypothetical protein